MKIRFQGQLDSIQWDTISTGTNLYEVSDFSEKYWEVICYFHGVLYNTHTIYQLMRLLN